MAETPVRSREGDESLKTMDREGNADRDYESKQKLRSKGWQVVSIPEVLPGLPKGSYYQLTENRYARAVMNVYQPWQQDEMHCHPGSEHLFMVVRGQLHIVGLDSEEDVVLKQGDFIHIKQSYFYQLKNETDDILVLYQVATKPAKPPKITRYFYKGPDDIDPRTLEGE
jgi:mannose-6-phosphate isomerase-like protein (cupin superfamily)